MAAVHFMQWTYSRRDVSHLRRTLDAALGRYWYNGDRPDMLRGGQQAQRFIVARRDNRALLFSQLSNAIKTLFNTLVPGSDPEITGYEVTNKE